MRYFVADYAAYESARMSLDVLVNMPPGETTLRPAAYSQTTAGGSVLFSQRESHCDLEPYASTLEHFIKSGMCVEISAEEFAALTQPGPPWPPAT